MILDNLQQKKNDPTMIRDYVYALYEYIKKSNDKELANNGELMNLMVEMLQLLKEDGSTDALAACDNICMYMCQAGRLSGQESEYWS